MNDVLEPPDDQPVATGRGAHRPHPGAVPVRDDRIDTEFSAFYHAEVRALVAFMLYLGASLPDAADLAQETMIDLYRSWPGVAHPKAWSRRVASRKYGRRMAAVETPGDLVDGSPLLPAQHDRTEWEQRHEIVLLLGSLPWRQRQVMAWTFDGYRPQEIAAELGISGEAVRSNLRLARRALATRLNREAGDEDE